MNTASTQPATEDARPLMSVLIVNYNGLIHLDECLTSVCSQSFRDFEVVFIDNASHDGSSDFVRKHFPQVKVVDSGSNRGFAGGNNFGLSFCRGTFIFFLNNDTRLEPGALAAIAVGIRDWPKTRVFACLMVRYYEPHLVDNAGEILYRFGTIYSHSGYPVKLFTAPREVIGACGGAAVYSRALLEEIGCFDDDFFLIFEDVDLSLRAKHHGESILFLPEARVHHKGSASIGGSFSRTAVYYSTRNFLPLFVKNVPFLTLLGFLPGIVFSHAVRTVQVLRHGQFLTFARGLKDSIPLIRKAMVQRKRILSESRIGRRGFEKLLRRNWLNERLAFKRGDYRHFAERP